MSWTYGDTLTFQTNVMQYSLEIISAGGTVTPSPGVHWYDENTEVECEATDIEDWTFRHWLLNGEKVEDNPVTVVMTRDHVLEAVWLFGRELADLALVDGVNVSKFRQHIISNGEDVSVKVLVLGVEDDETGWLSRQYASHSVRVVLVQKGESQANLGYWTVVRYSAVASTTRDIRDGDILIDEQDRQYEVASYVDHYVQGKFQLRVLQLNRVLYGGLI